jgi:hypothetical protein
MEPVQHMLGWARTRCLAQIPWSLGAVTQEGDRRVRRGAQAFNRMRKKSFPGAGSI